MYFNDHPPPHFHLRAGGTTAKMAIGSEDVLAGGLPTKQVKMAREWAEANRAGLFAAWEELSSGRPLSDHGFEAP